MKQYIKDSEVKYANQISIVKDGLVTLNPSEEEIIKDGWIVYTPKEPTEEELLERAKQDKLYEIDSYDKSEDVNSFYLKGSQVWLDKDTRVGLTNSLNYEKAAGRKESTMWFNENPITLPIEDAFKMLAALELYALDCYNVTARHKAEVNKLTTIKEVEAYDYKSGYPQKLEL